MTALIIIVLIIMIVVLYRHRQPRKLPLLVPGKSTDDGNIVFMGKAESLEEAKTLAKTTPGAKTFIYYGKDAGDYAKMVYAIKRGDLIIPKSDQYETGSLRDENFDSKQVMRLGAQHAGESMVSHSVTGSYDDLSRFQRASWQPMTNKSTVGSFDDLSLHSRHVIEGYDTGVHTNWDGYMKTTTGF